MDPSMLDNGTQPKGLIANIVVIGVIGTISMTIRFWGRIICDCRLWWDDWMALATWPCYLGVSIVFGLGAVYGFGVEPYDLTHEQRVASQKLLIASYWFNNWGLTTIKFSILLFYKRVFGPSRPRWFKVASWVAAVIIFCRLVINSATSLTQCKPLAKNFDMDLPGECVDECPLYMLSAVPDVVPDLIIIVIPHPVIWKMHARTSRKAVMTALFFCGYAAASVSLASLITFAVLQVKCAPDLTYMSYPNTFIVVNELGGAIIAVCLPASIAFFSTWRKHGWRGLFRRHSLPEAQTIVRATDGYLAGEIAQFQEKVAQQQRYREEVSTGVATLTNRSGTTKTNNTTEHLEIVSEISSSQAASRNTSTTV